MQLILTGEMIDAQEAHRIGLVNKVVPAADLAAEAEKMLRGILAMGPLAVRLAMEAVDQGVELAEKLGRLPKFADLSAARREDESLLTEWQVYRMFDARRGAWSTFQFLVRQRLSEQGREVATQRGGQ